MTAIDFGNTHWQVIGGNLTPRAQIASSGGDTPNAAILNVADNADKSDIGAVATLTGCTAGVTYKVYTRKHQVRDWTLSGTRVGDGTVALSLAKGEYVATVIGVASGASSSVGQAVNFWVTSGEMFRHRTRDRIALTALRVLSGGGTSRAKGIQVTIITPGEDDVTVWAEDKTDQSQVTSLRHGDVTDDREAEYAIPRQSGFPLDEWKVGMQLTAEGITYGVHDIEGSISLAPIFTFHCSRYGDGSDGTF